MRVVNEKHDTSSGVVYRASAAQPNTLLHENIHEVGDPVSRGSTGEAPEAQDAACWPTVLEEVYLNSNNNFHHLPQDSRAETLLFFSSRFFFRSLALQKDYSTLIYAKGLRVHSTTNSHAPAKDERLGCVD